MLYFYSFFWGVSFLIIWGLSFYHFGCFLGTGDSPETTLASGSPEAQNRTFPPALLEVILGFISAPGGFKVCNVFLRFVDWPFGRHFAKFVRQRGPKGVPTGTILRPLGGTVGNVKTMVRFCENIVLRVGGGPERALVQDFAHSVFQAATWNSFFAMFYRFGVPLETLGGQFFVIFGILFQKLIFE